MTIPDEAVEAAAKASHASRWPNAPWDALNDDARTYTRGNARLALEAAAPFIRAQALEDAADELAAHPRLRKSQLAWAIYPDHMATKEKSFNECADILRARAAAERGGE